MKKSTTYPTLKAWRAAQNNGQGISQADAAKLLDLSVSEYNRFENQVRYARGHIAKRLTERTGVPVAVLVGAA